MKKILITLVFLNVALIASAQTFQSNQFSKFSSLYERIDFYDEEGSMIVSLAPRFYKHRELKKWMKPIKIKGQTYFIKIEKFGVQSVYNDKGEHLADMERDGSKIHFIQDNSTYYLRPRVKLANFNILECRNSEEELAFKISFNSDRKLSYESEGEQSPNLLLMSLCAHQYQELLLGDRGRLSGAF
jgi:hypothetical protein